MASVDDRAEWSLRPWAGTIGQLRQAAQQCEEKVTAAAPFPEDYGPDVDGSSFDPRKHSDWRDAEEAREVVVKIVEDEGYGRRLASIAGLEDLGQSRLDRVRRIDIEIGGGHTSPSAAIRASGDRGLSVDLVGPDRSWTAGLRRELEETLKPAGRLRPRTVGLFGLVVAAIALIGVRLPALELLAPGEKPAYERWRSRILAAVGAVVLGVVATFVAGWIG